MPGGVGGEGSRGFPLSRFGKHHVRRRTMKMKSKVNFAYLIGMSLLLFTGCASFPRNHLPSVGNLPRLTESTNKPSASYSFSSGVDLFRKQEHQENVRKQLEDEFVCVLRESGHFASLAPGDQGDMNIEVRLVNSGTPAAMIPAFITGLSLYTIPSWATDTYTITAKVRAIDGKMYTYELEDSMTTVQWLPMIVVAPFKNMVSVSKEVRRNIWRNLILKMQEDGVLCKRENTAITSSLNLQFKWRDASSPGRTKLTL
jgi:hypothetical protein